MLELCTEGFVLKGNDILIIGERERKKGVGRMEKGRGGEKGREGVEEERMKEEGRKGRRGFYF